MSARHTAVAAHNALAPCRESVVMARAESAITVLERRETCFDDARGEGSGSTVDPAHFQLPDAVHVIPAEQPFERGRDGRKRSTAGESHSHADELCGALRGLSGDVMLGR